MRRSIQGSMALVLVTVVIFGALGAGLTAQEMVEVSHPSHVHQGTCADLDPSPDYPLANVGPVSPDAESGSVEVGVTSLDVSLDDLVAEPFAVNLHESAENVENYIACGDITGAVVDGTLVIGLNEVNDSGYSGVAVLSATNSGGTDVTIYLGFGLSRDVAEATPVASSADPAGVAISILEYAFDAPTVEIPVGTTVTWTNDGGVIHTTTSTDGLWDSEILSSDDEFTYTFNEAGSFEYICSLHPSMVGEIVVTEA